MTHFTAPAQPLTDGVVTLRLPSPAGDIDTVRGYIEQEQLDGGWLPEIPLVSAEQAISDWLNVWAGRPSRNGEMIDPFYEQTDVLAPDDIAYMVTRPRHTAIGELWIMPTEQL